MMNLEFMKKQIQAMDVKSEEFWGLYQVVSDKYWTLPKDADDFQKAAQLLHLFAERGDEDQVIVCYKMVEMLLQMKTQKLGAIAGVAGFADTEYHFTISTDKDQMAKLMEMLKNTVLVKAKEEKT